ncbi:sulfurtransferase [Saccharopolyspora sp. K220]|uniref:sulfurtransferase n=1 Tax=Saccharopolyspora soli TaxID=2926618 RepID=UPI001F5949EE|nr:rhodanese-like domain-containing protein [Saccharopolyspora soli]MCI2416001.1 sulfurtransferase [Saccharopolyspora soli]
MSAPVFVSASELADLLDKNRDDVRLLEVRREPDGASSADPIGHLPGAVAVDLVTELARNDAPPAQGRRPLPRIDELQRAARRWGLRNDSTAVVYDDRSGLVAARAWWVLRWAGLERVRILDGGLRAWTAVGRALGALADDVPPGDVTLRGGALPELNTDEAAELAARNLLIDARAEDAFHAGHIPNARNISSRDALGPDGTLRDAAELRAHYGLAAPGAPVPGMSCGGGVAGAFGVAVLAHLGFTAPLYVGSFSAWSADPDRPVATGPEPSTVEDPR